MPSYSEKDKPEKRRESVRATAGNRTAQMGEYETNKKKLKELLNKKKNLDRELNTLEEDIFRQEGVYLDETPNGNVVKGFENYLRSNPNKRRLTLSDQDRIFSLSSAVFLKAKMRDEEDETNSRTK